MMLPSTKVSQHAGRSVVPGSSTERLAMDSRENQLILNSAAMPTKRLWIGDSIEVPCNIEIEQTHDTLHAHVSLEGIEVEHGDEVLVHEALSHIGFGERLVSSSTATVWRANSAVRALIRLKSYLQLTELYEVGFQPKEEIVFVTSNAKIKATTNTNKSED